MISNNQSVIDNYSHNQSKPINPINGNSTNQPNQNIIDPNDLQQFFLPDLEYHSYFSPYNCF